MPTIDAEAVDVRQLLEGDGLALHLAPDGVRRFLAALHLRLDAARAEFGGKLLLDARDDGAVAGAQIGEPRLDHRVGFRRQRAERQVLEFVAQALHAHASGERRIDVEGFLGDAPALALGHEMQRAHVVQPVGELDEQHAHVGGDRQQELAEILRLLGALGDEVELLDLGQPVDELADLRAEDLVDLLARRGRVLDRVVQHRGDDGRVVEPHFRQDRGDFERMAEIGVAGGALLHAVGAHRVDIGLVQQFLVRVRIVPAHAFDEFILPHHCKGRPGKVAIDLSGISAFAPPHTRAAKRRRALWSTRRIARPGEAHGEVAITRPRRRSRPEARGLRGRAGGLPRSCGRTGPRRSDRRARRRRR